MSATTFPSLEEEKVQKFTNLWLNNQPVGGGIMEMQDAAVLANPASVEPEKCHRCRRDRGPLGWGKRLCNSCGTQMSIINRARRDQDRPPLTTDQYLEHFPFGRPRGMGVLLPSEKEASAERTDQPPRPMEEKGSLIVTAEVDTPEETMASAARFLCSLPVWGFCSEAVLGMVVYETALAGAPFLGISEEVTAPGRAKVDGALQGSREGLLRTLATKETSLGRTQAPVRAEPKPAPSTRTSSSDLGKCLKCPSKASSDLTGLCPDCNNMYHRWKNLFTLEEQVQKTVLDFLQMDIRTTPIGEPAVARVVNNRPPARVLANTTNQTPTTWAASTTAMAQVYNLIRRIAPSDETVLITGETGTGKELVAKTIHRLSSRAGRGLVVVDSTSLRKELAWSELFGHEAGSFTGAVKERKGMFYQANASTMFIDEVSELDLDVQAALLRVLQEGEYRPVGSNHYYQTDVRIICATNKNLLELVEKGKFREDLYARLDVVHINVPPLRERPEEIPELVRHLIEKISKRMVEVTEAAMLVLQSYQWPRNVRQLENALRSALVMSNGSCIKMADLRPDLLQAVRQKGG